MSVPPPAGVESDSETNAQAEAASESPSSVPSMETGGPSPEKRPRRRRWSLALRILALLVAILIATLFAALRYIESDRGRALVRETALEDGVALDYDRFVFQPFDGHLVLRGLRFESPSPFSEVAPHWLTVDRIEIWWSPSELLSGTLHITRLLVEGVRGHEVIDEEGNDSITAALAGLEDEEAVETPLSRTLVDLDLPLPLRVDELIIRDVEARSTELRPGGGRSDTSVVGLELQAWLRGEPESASLEGEIALVSPDGGTRIAITQTDGETEQRQEADLRHSSTVTIEGGDTAKLTSSVDVVRQTFDDDVALTGPVLALAATARFDPEAETTRFALERFELLEGVARGTLSAALHDRAHLPTIEGGEATLLVDPLIALLPTVFEGITAEGAQATMQVRPTEPDDGSSLARVEIRGEATRLGATTDGDTVQLDDLTLAIDANVGPERASIEGAVTSGPIEAVSGGERFGIEHARMTLAMPATDGASFEPTVQLAFGEIVATLEARTRARVAPSELEIAFTDLTPELDRPARFEGSGAIPRVEVTMPGERTIADGIALDFSGQIDGPNALSLASTLRIATVRMTSPGSSLRVNGARLELGLDDVELNDDDVAASRASITANLRADRVESREGDQRVQIAAPGFSLAGPYRGAEPSTFSGNISMGGVRFAEGEGALQTIVGGGRLRYTLGELVVNAEEPLGSRGVLHAEGRLPPFAVDLDGRLGDGDAEVTFHVHADSLKAILAALQTDAPEGMELEQTGIDVRLRGGFHDLLTDHPRLDQTLSVTVTNAGTSEPGFSIRLPRIALVLEHRGDGPRHQGKVSLDVDRPVLNGHPFEGTLGLRGEGRFDTAQRTGNLEGTLSGPDGLTGSVNADVTIAANGRIRHRESLSLAHLGFFAAAMPPDVREVHPVDLDAMTIEITGGGTIDNALLPDRSGLVENWEAKSHIEQTLALTFRGIRYTPEGLRAEIPEMRIEIEGTSDPAGSSAEGKLIVPRAEIEDVGNHHIVVHELVQNLHFTAEGPVVDRKIKLESDGSIARVEQDILPAYPMENLSLDARFTMEGFETMELERFVLHNERGGTTLELQKTLGRSNARRNDGRRMRGAQHLAVRGRLIQRLERINATPQVFRASGLLTAPFSIDSADGSLYRIHATLRLENVDLEIPEMELHVEGLRANIPMEEAVEWDPEAGLVVVPSTDRNVFARVRFQDVQHFLSGDSYLEMRRLRFSHFDAGPIVASLRIERNVFSLNGVRIEKGDALISGQLVIDYVPGSERIAFRGNVTGLRPRGSNDPLDANAAITFDPHRLELDGRIQIVRISRHHLRQLIELVDPYGEDGSLNLLRRALRLGHPKRVAIRLSQGLMSMNVELGGILGSLIRIGEIQGIALGPFMTRHVAPLMP